SLSLCDLPFVGSHLFPQDFQIALYPGICWVFMKGSREPFIRRRQITAGAVPSGIHCAQEGKCLGVGGACCGCQISPRTVAILRNTGSVEISLSFRREPIIGGVFNGRGLRLGGDRLLYWNRSCFFRRGIVGRFIFSVTLFVGIGVGIGGILSSGSFLLWAGAAVGSLRPGFRSSGVRRLRLILLRCDFRILRSSFRILRRSFILRHRRRVWRSWSLARWRRRRGLGSSGRCSAAVKGN